MPKTPLAATIFKKVSGAYADNKDNVGPGVATAKVAHVLYKNHKALAAAGGNGTGTLANTSAGAQAIDETVEAAAQKGGFFNSAKSFLGKNAGKLGIGFSVASIGWDVAKEKGHFLEKGPDGGTRLGHKGERLIASTATAAPTLAVSAFQLAAGGAATTVGTTVAVIAVPAVATYAIKKDADTVIETRRLYEQVDNAFQPGTHKLRHPKAGLPPDAQAKSYDNLLPAARMVSRYIIDANLSHPVARNKDGSIKNINDLDLSDGRNRRELRRALNLAIADEQKIADDNGSLVPRWMRHGSGVEAEQAALVDKRQLESAETELGQYAAAVNNYKRAQKSAPALG